MTRPTPQKDGTPVQLYVPSLHRERAPGRLPQTVLLLDPGLPRTGVPGTYHPVTYPFSREDAARVLHELLAVGEALDVAGPTGRSAARAVSGTGNAIPDDEEAAIARFAATGSGAPVAQAPDVPGENARIAAQKILLLAWDLENRLEEIAVLRRQVADAVKPLAENLHGPENADPLLRDIARALPGALPETLADLPESVEPDWRLTLAAAAAFLPRNALLVTGHAGMRKALEEAHLLSPLTGETAAALDGWTAEARTGLLHARAPLWKVLGREREPENSPWLLEAPAIIVLPSQG